MHKPLNATDTLKTAPYIEVLHAYNSDLAHGLEWAVCEPDSLILELHSDMQCFPFDMNNKSYNELALLAQNHYVVEIPDVGTVLIDYPNTELLAS